MDFLLEGFLEGMLRVFQGDPLVYEAAWVTLRVSLGATLIASLIGVPLGYLLASTSFRGKGFCTILLQTLLGLPTVVIGLLVYGFISRRGPLGFEDLLFTPSGIVIGLVILALPITAMFTMTAVSGIDPRAREMALTLVASPFRSALTLFLEVRLGLVSALLASFGRVTSEVGIAIMLGGNIQGYTRTLTTAIALESMKGEFGFGIALGMLLLTLVFFTALLSRYVQKL